MTTEEQIKLYRDPERTRKREAFLAANGLDGITFVDDIPRDGYYATKVGIRKGKVVCELNFGMTHIKPEDKEKGEKGDG